MPTRKLALALLLAAVALVLAPTASTTVDAAAELTPAQYRAAIAKLGRDSAKQHGIFEAKVTAAKTPVRLADAVAFFAAAELRLSRAAAKLAPPADARGANARLVRGAKIFAQRIRKTIPAVSAATTVKAGIAVLIRRLEQTDAAAELDAALEELAKLGYRSAD